MARIGRALTLGAAATLYGIPWAIARACVLARRAYRFSIAAIRLGWKDGFA